MASEQDKLVRALKASLKDSFKSIDTSQGQVKYMVSLLDAKVEALAKSMGPLHSAAVLNAVSREMITIPSINQASGKTSPPEPISPPGRVSGRKGGGGAALAHAGANFDKTDVAHLGADPTASLTGSLMRKSNSNVGSEPTMTGVSSIAFDDANPMDSSGSANFSDNRGYLGMRVGFQELITVRRGLLSKPRASLSRIVSIGSDFEQYVTDQSRTTRNSRFNAWSPDSRPRRILDIIGMTMVLYDAFMVPFWLAWDFTWPVGFWTTCVFWTIDLPTQFITGYRYKDGRLELDLGKAALRYVQTWCMLDMTVVLCDWIAALGNVSSAMRYLRVMRLVRGGRQVLRFFLALQKYKLSSQFIEVHLSVDITLLLAFILWVNHLVCCGWYWIGTNADSDTGWTWTKEAGVSDVGTPYEYSTSLHWALTQMTPASMEVVPECTMERVLNVFIIVFGMILGSVFAATLTSSMTQYRLYKERVSNNFMQLQSYLAQQGVEPELSMAVKMHVKHQLRMRQRLHWKSVSYLDFASRSLKEALWHACCMKLIRKHAFLHSLQFFDQAALGALCNGAILTFNYSRGDIVFEVGVKAKDGHMYYLTYGSLFYDPGETAAECDVPREDSRLHLGEGAFVSEASLWTQWQHLGTLFVEAPSECFQVSSSKLQDALAHRFPDTMSIIVQYCIAFHASMNEPGTLRSDLGSSLDTLDIMTAMETPVRVSLAEPILDQLRIGKRFGHRLSWNKDMDNLEEEIHEGKCNLGFEEEEPVRTVFVVALKLWKNIGDDHFLVKVGEVDRQSGAYKPACVLPGTKRKGKETARAAMQRVFDSEFVKLYSSLTILPGNSKVVFIKQSPTYGVRTRYLRTTYDAALSDDCEVDTAGNDWDSIGSADKRRGSWTHSQDSSALLNLDSGCMSRVWSWLNNARRKCPGCCSADTDASDDDTENRGKERAPKARILEILRQTEEAIVVPTNEHTRTKFSINIWLTQEEFNILQQDSATAFINSWIKSVKLDGVVRAPTQEEDNPDGTVSHQVSIRSLIPSESDHNSSASCHSGMIHNSELPAIELDTADGLGDGEVSSL